ncbi:GGDEF domain-containing protein [Devosia sp. A16]|uniref:GGDEF domain-containing protein n=1 Tax=Devosia sp. A16 TaxID=1736675 RepID=UPI0006D7F5EC|nr:GGDEF domain-containing protein [Devosia sp. A16]
MHLMLIPPIVLAAFAMSLGGMWLIDRRRLHLLLLAGGFAGFGTAILVQVLELPPQSAFSSVVSATLYAAGATLFSLGVIWRSERRGLPIPLLVLPLVLVATLAWFSYVDDQLLVRIYVLNFGLGLIGIVGTWYARRLVDGSVAERTLFWLQLTLALHFFPRTLLAVGRLGSGISDPQRFGGSDFWILTLYAGAVLGVVIGIGVVLVTAADLMAGLQRERDTDALTGALNRRGLEAHAGALLEQPVFRPIALIACDIDHFKAINDQFGHHAGDLVLQHIGTLLRANCRATDIVARIGGEEFVVALPNTTAAEGFELAERLRRLVAETAGSHAPSVTCSFGVAELQDHDADIWAGLQRADRQLYAAKHAGRNRTAVELLGASVAGVVAMGESPRLVASAPGRG